MVIHTEFALWKVLLLTVVALLAIGCGAPTDRSQTPPEEARQPFSARHETQDGAVVAWSGYTRGYEPGAQAEFGLAIQNETDQSWHGRYCLQLVDRQLPQVIATLEQREFALEPGVGFSDTVSVRFPEGLGEGAYGLSLAVRRPDGPADTAHPIVDLVSIQVGETDEVRRATTQQDMDASLEACAPPAAADTDNAASLVALAKADLAQRLKVNGDQIEVQNVTPAQFPDASLGVPESGKVYAQVLTSGYVIELAAAGQTYRYHASGDRVVAVPGDGGRWPSGRIDIQGVEVTATQVLIRGESTLPDGTCLRTELWADGVLQTWWPADACATVRQGGWQLSVPLGTGRALQPGVQYVVRTYGPSGPKVIDTFPFDLDGPPTPSGQSPENDPVGWGWPQAQSSEPAVQMRSSTSDSG
jgi:hypothetical protein